MASRGVCYDRFETRKIVRITRVDEQDETRRADMRKMTPAERMEALITLRDQLYPYAPLERVATIRSLDGKRTMSMKYNRYIII